MSRTIILAALVSVATGLPVATFAQNDASQQTAEELQELFEQQKTRGLVIAPSGASGGSQASAQPAETQLATASVYTPVDEGTEINLRISFDFDSALLREDQKPKLATLCEAINNMEGQIFRIVGHTDSKGSEAYNENLSLLRASEVKRYMVGSCGIAEDRLLAIGAGEMHPANETDPTADENRRVEFQLIS